MASDNSMSDNDVNEAAIIQEWAETAARESFGDEYSPEDLRHEEQMRLLSLIAMHLDNVRASLMLLREEIAALYQEIRTRT